MLIDCCELFYQLLFSPFTPFSIFLQGVPALALQVVTTLLRLLLLSRFCLSELYSSLHILGSWPRPPRAWEFLRRRGPFKRQAPGAVAARIGGALSHVAVLAARAVARLWWRQWDFWGGPWEGAQVSRCAWRSVWSASRFVPATWLLTSRTRWGGAGAGWWSLPVGDLSPHIVCGPNTASRFLSDLFLTVMVKKTTLPDALLEVRFVGRYVLVSRAVISSLHILGNWIFDWWIPRNFIFGYVDYFFGKGKLLAPVPSRRKIRRRNYARFALSSKHTPAPESPRFQKPLNTRYQSISISTSHHWFSNLFFLWLHPRHFEYI